MKPNHSLNNDRKVRLVETLLEVLYQSEEGQAQTLVSKGLKRIESTRTGLDETSLPALNVETKSRKPGIARWQLISLTTAALILIAFCIPFLLRPNLAMAAVNRSLQQAIADIGRHYKVVTVNRSENSRTISREASLFVKGANRLAIQTKVIFGQHDIWLGNNQGQAWVVPPIGPVLEGNSRDLSLWLLQRNDIQTPYLHVSTFLERMREHYQLENLSPATIPGHAIDVQCHRIIGNLKTESERQLPHQVELWADPTSGIALKIRATFQLGKNDSGRESITFEFVEEIDLKDEFFSPDFHGGKDRNRIRFGQKHLE